MQRLNLFLSLFSVLLLSCSAGQIHKNKEYIPSGDHLILLSQPETKMLYKHLNVNTNLVNGSKVSGDENIGSFQPYPGVLSTKYHYQILESGRLYREKNFQQAAGILKEPYENEKQNPFILDSYARALFNFDSEKSYEIYKQLIDLLDEEKNISLTFVINGNREPDKEIYAELAGFWEQIKTKKKSKIVLDPWFSEAYWKIGCLYLDRQDWLNGAFEISRGLYLGLGKNPVLLEQALGYLTEAMYFLKKDKLALYFANEALSLNPSNKYVLKYMNSIYKK